MQQLRGGRFLPRLRIPDRAGVDSDKPVYEDLFPDSEHKTRSMSDLPLLSSIEDQREIMFDGYNTPHSLIREFL
jgi:hypothetical protein